MADYTNTKHSYTDPIKSLTQDIDQETSNKDVCGIILAGGTGSRLYPATKAMNKHLLCLYDKPVIFYPISTLMLAGVRDICLICSPEFEDDFKKLLGDGSEFGVKMTYQTQARPNGIAEAYKIASSFINGRRSVMILGDNILFGDRLGSKIHSCINETSKNFVFGYTVQDPRPFGVITHNKKFCVTEIEEKPEKPKSNLASVGLYVLNGNATNLVNQLKPSARNELEITDLLNLIAQQHHLDVTILGRGYAWLDTGTPKDLLAAANFVATLQERQGYMIGCIHEIGISKNWVSSDKKTTLQKTLTKSSYDNYLNKILS